MKLNAVNIRYLSSDEFRILQVVMHAFVYNRWKWDLEIMRLINSLSKMGPCAKILKGLVKNKLIAYESAARCNDTKLNFR